MGDRPLRIGVAYNAFEKRKGGAAETISESSVALAARDVASAVSSLGHDTTLLPLRRSLEGFLRRLRTSEVDIVVNLCEGFRGKPQWEFAIAGIFEVERIPFTGNTASALALCQDKFKTKAVLQASGLPTAPHMLVTRTHQEGDLPFPVIVKPNNEDASLGIYSDCVVWDESSLASKVSEVLKRYEQPALVESFIDGREFNVAVREESAPTALPVSEIDFTGMPEGAPRICGYEAKWFENHVLFASTKPVCPADIPQKLADTLQTMAVVAFKAVGCRDYARVDFRTDEKGRVYVLEVNPNPDVSLNAGFVRALAAAGIPYAKFWDGLIRRVLQRKEEM
jgi:D-alanine-D-alanine ligase